MRQKQPGLEKYYTKVIGTGYWEKVQSEDEPIPVEAAHQKKPLAKLVGGFCPSPQLK